MKISLKENSRQAYCWEIYLFYEEHLHLEEKNKRKKKKRNHKLWARPSSSFKSVGSACTQVEEVRPETTGSGKLPAISGSRIPKSVPDSGSDWFPANSGIRTLLTYPFVVSQAVPVSSNDDRIQARFPSDPVRILKSGSDRFRVVPPVSTTPQIPDSRANLRVPS